MQIHYLFGSHSYGISRLIERDVFSLEQGSHFSVDSYDLVGMDVDNINKTIVLKGGLQKIFILDKDPKFHYKYLKVFLKDDESVFRNQEKTPHKIKIFTHFTQR